MEKTLLEQVQESIAYIRTKCIREPEIAIVLGSGLDLLVNFLEDAITIDCRDIPHFSISTAPGHEGKMIFAKLGGKDVLCMQGRIHYYEGYGIQQCVYGIRVMAKMGIEKIIFSNAAGGINTEFRPGDLMLITDHINFMGINPLIGPNEYEFGPRFHDMTYAYSKELKRIALQAARDLEIELQQGIYVACSGPNYETPAEIRMFRVMDADAVGMSTVPEVIVARHCGIDVLAISCITNMAAGITDQLLSEEEVLETGRKSGTMFCDLVTRIIELM